MWCFKIDQIKSLELLTFEAVEKCYKVERVEAKTRRYAQSQGDDPCLVYRIKPSLVAHLYSDWIMPLTKRGSSGILAAKARLASSLGKIQY